MSLCGCRRLHAHAHGDTTMEAYEPTDISPNDDTSSPSVALKGKPKSKGKSKSPVEPKGKRSLNLSIPHEDYERLAIHAMRADTTISELVCQLARTHLREFHLTRTAVRSTD
jgi:hypothetical protein